MQLCAPLLLVAVMAVTAVSGEFKLLILHTNDMHARFEQTSRISSKCSSKDIAANNCYGGFARVAQKVKEAREAFKQGTGPPAIFLNGGDNYQGTVWYNVHKWKITADLTSLLDFDAMALGNHEFDDGVQGLAPFVNNVSFPVVAANLNFSEEPVMAQTVKPSVVLEVAGERVGIIGYLTSETKEIAKTGKVIFSDEVESVRAEAARLKGLGVNILIAVGHAGFTVDQKIAEEVPDIDVVVGGHSNTFLYSGPSPDSIDIVQGPYPFVVKQASGRLVPVVQAYAYTKYMGNLEVTFNDNGEATSWTGNPILLDKTVPQDDVVLRALEVWRKDIETMMTSRVGVAKVFLRGEAKFCRMHECNLGNFLADAMVNYFVSTSVSEQGTWTSAPVAVFNSGGLRANIDVLNSQGEITMGDIIGTLPFENSLIFVQIKGKHLLQAFEWSVARYDKTGRDPVGAFLQVSGFRVRYDLGRAPSQRVVSVSVRCGNCTEPLYQPLDPETVYGVLTTTYIAQGGDGFKMKDNLLEQRILDTTDTGVLSEYVKKRSPIYPEVEERIIFSDFLCLSTKPRPSNQISFNKPHPMSGGFLSPFMQAFLKLGLDRNNMNNT